MAETVIVWDIETVPDLEAYATAADLEGKPESEVRDGMGEKFPKPVFHKIVCIGALIAARPADAWQIQSIGAPHIGARTEKELIQSFVDRIAEFKTRLVTFNGSSFDLPVLRYRAMIHSVSAPGLAARNYFNRYTDDALDLCDVLSSFQSRGMVSLHELCRVLGLPGKPDGIDGSQVESYFRDGRIKEIADYCETDVVNTYRAWLRYELFRGTLTPQSFDLSETNLVAWIRGKAETKAHLLSVI
jgi:3'-5' exonuclease